MDQVAQHAGCLEHRLHIQVLVVVRDWAVVVGLEADLPSQPLVLLFGDAVFPMVRRVHDVEHGSGASVFHTLEVHLVKRVRAKANAGLVNLPEKERVQEVPVSFEHGTIHDEAPVGVQPQA